MIFKRHFVTLLNWISYTCIGIHIQIYEYWLSSTRWNSKYYIVHETAICHNRHNLQNWDFRMSRRLSHEHTFCQNVVSTTFLLVLMVS
jgi:hypothetical protein